MSDLKKVFKLYNKRVSRTYKGGKLLDSFHGKIESEDTYTPEEWIGSTTTVSNLEVSQAEGLSYTIISQQKIILKDLIYKYPEELLGKRHLDEYGKNTAVLVKLIDTAERLTIQVHPNKERAKKFFDSDFGKTEAWYILNTRIINEKHPYILLGFKSDITKEQWVSLFENQDINGMISLMNKIFVTKGDVFLVEAGVPHAIGPGCFLIEIQEPTDYTFRMEKKTVSGLELSDAQCHQGIGYDKMFECFNYQGYTKNEVINKWKLDINNRKDQLSGDQGIKCGEEITLIDYNDTPNFKMKEYRIKSFCEIENVEERFSILIVKSGKGFMLCDEEQILLNQGDSFFLSASLKNIQIVNQGNSCLSLIQCFPPRIS